ncbi:uncharacterized protein BO97DRAFT_428004 [Aspergillus homomorphus CBS 101889]|uniref:Uncharacterized protein n=1 Tax=Aspergillus homomorphus (strain CBS 101889) TaxID=1450537 RepID=A0A395HRP0_ASPHC|nr:hypothetical protein BO97DRAFT_428004 [Aspergillus homomorphus CBS 101889]RAL08904.1 hypothetical protein BO97DRAFT_428004 [Aspergillus homomorphus CBS 101889]
MTGAAKASPFMDTLLDIPALSVYAQVYNLTGGIVQINLMLSERFSYDYERNYTFLAPTNDAYILIEALPWTHIIEACLTASDLVGLSERDSDVGDSHRTRAVSYIPAVQPGVLIKIVQRATISTS